jgi:hypothetical protein
MTWIGIADGQRNLGDASIAPVEHKESSITEFANGRDVRERFLRDTEEVA